MLPAVGEDGAARQSDTPERFLPVLCSDRPTVG